MAAQPARPKPERMPERLRILPFRRRWLLWTGPFRCLGRRGRLQLRSVPAATTDYLPSIGPCRTHRRHRDRRCTGLPLVVALVVHALGARQAIIRPSCRGRMARLSATTGLWTAIIHAGSWTRRSQNAAPPLLPGSGTSPTKGATKASGGQTRISRLLPT